ncbi:cell division protein FtsK [Collinsella intestinalis]|nr:cell division protein FtsK [Collinsella intestinalis]
MSILLTQALVSQALKRTAPGQLRVIAYDAGLTGLFAPFQGLNAGGERLLEFADTEQDLAAALQRMRAQVQNVNNVVQGRAANLPDFRAAVDYPVEQYYLVVVSADFSMLPKPIQAMLYVLFKAGPAAGVSFMVHSSSMAVEDYVLRRCLHLKVRAGTVTDASGKELARGFPFPTADELVALSHDVAARVQTMALDTIPFADIQPLNEGRRWRASSANGITFAIGRYGVETVEVTLGDELNQRHNALITGAVGQGKSNLISVMIHSLCERYSPQELELYLLDFKEGVTLRPFCKQADGSFLPHARVIGLEADREFGVSVLEHLFGVYRERLQLFKAHGVQNIRQYRASEPQAVMSRILLVIDEFQLMFSEQDKTSDEAADLLVRAVRLFRAAGIHIVMASQTLGGNLALTGSAGEGLFAQVPVRIALKNSLAESHATLGATNDAAAYLRAREAIVNEDYGAPSSNRRTSIAFADERVLGPLRRTWWKRARGAKPPYVFSGGTELMWTDVDARRLRERLEGFAAPLGARVGVGGTIAAAPLTRDVGRNVALFGSGDVALELASIACALAAEANGGDSLRFVVLDGCIPSAWWRDLRAALARVLAAHGAVQVIERAEVPAAVDELVGTYIGAGGQDSWGSFPSPGSFFSEGPGDAPAASAAEPERLAENEEVFVLGFGLERVSAMPESFQRLCSEGPARGIHVLGWWRKLPSFTAQAGYDGLDAFDVRMVFHLEQEAVKDIMRDPILRFRPRENRALLWDTSYMDDPATVIPFSAFAAPAGGGR